MNDGLSRKIDTLMQQHNIPHSNYAIKLWNKKVDSVTVIRNSEPVSVRVKGLPDKSALDAIERAIR